MSKFDNLHAKTQGAVRNADGSVLWRIWAPTQPEVRLVVWNKGQRVALRMQPDGEGYFTHHEADVPEGYCYAYRLPNVDLDLPDPASRWQPEGVHKPSAVFSPGNFLWNDAAWHGVLPQDLVIYELHVGTFTPEGTFAAIIPRLPELVDLGITALELLPISQFPGERNWGYDGVHPYAAQNTYGGPQGLQQLVDAAHQAGLAVVLDCVYNHLGPEGNYLSLFGPYFTDRYHTPWGQALNYDDRQSDAVRKYVIDNACYWIRDFHLDGLRLDAVQTIYDLSPKHLLAEIQENVQAQAQADRRSIVIIAETNQNDARLTNAPEVGGYGLSGVWSDDFHHCIHALLTGEREGYYSEFGAVEQLAKTYNEVFTFNGCYSPYHQRRQGSPVGDTPREKFTVCIQNHDQVGNRPRGDRLSKLLPPSSQRLAAALMLLSPFTPLLFMGEEYGEERPFAFFCSFLDPSLVAAVRAGRRREFAELAFKWGGKIPDPQAQATFTSAKLNWAWPQNTPAAGMRAMYRCLLDGRKNWAGLREEFTHARGGNAGEPSFILQRGQQSPLHIWANLTNLPQQIQSGPPGPLLFSTAEVAWGGTQTTSELATQPNELLPWELRVWDASEMSRENI